MLEQLPNRIYPNGIKSDVSGMAEAFEKGRKLLSSQSYEIKSFIADGDRLSVEALWTGTLALAFGSLAAGSQMRAHSAMFFQFKDGKVVRQRNYDWLRAVVNMVRSMHREKAALSGKNQRRRWANRPEDTRAMQ